MDENDRCDQHGRSLDHPWGCFGCSMSEYLSKNPTTWEPFFPSKVDLAEWREKQEKSK